MDGKVQSARQEVAQYFFLPQKLFLSNYEISNFYAFKQSNRKSNHKPVKNSYFESDCQSNESPECESISQSDSRSYIAAFDEPNERSFQKSNQWYALRFCFLFDVKYHALNLQLFFFNFTAVLLKSDPMISKWRSVGMWVLYRKSAKKCALLWVNFH